MVQFFFRWFFAFALLTLTYNPTPYNYINWVWGGSFTPVSLMVLTGLLLVVGYIIYIRATIRSIGVGGMALVLSLFSAVIWVLNDLGTLDLNDVNRNIWLTLLAMSLVLGVGLSWSHVRRRLSGQHDVDDLGDEED